MINVRIKNIKGTPYTERDFAPTEADIGLVVSVVATSTESSELFDTHSFHDDQAKKLVALTKQDSLTVFYCITADGRKLQLIDYEVEIVGI